MLHAGLDLSRRRLDVCVVDDAGELVEHTAAPPGVDGLRRFVERASSTAPLTRETATALDTPRTSSSEAGGCSARDPEALADHGLLVGQIHQAARGD